MSERVTKLEDNQELTDAKVLDQSQTKVESGSKYRVRLSGMVLLNAFETRGSVDNLDFPEVATRSRSAGTLPERSRDRCASHNWEWRCSGRTWPERTPAPT